MSGAIRIAKAQYRGDPGLFSFVGKALGGIANVVSKVVPGPIGAVAGLAGKVLAGNGKPQNPSINVAKMGAAAPVLLAAAPQMPQLPQLRPDSTVTRGVSLFPGGPMVGSQTQHYSPAGAHPGQGCGAGYHVNKTGYYTQQGYVAPGTRCVRNRRRNPLNPRAASRAMSRLTSAKKATRSILKFFGSSNGRRSAGPARKGGCGCKGRR